MQLDFKCCLLEPRESGVSEEMRRELCGSQSGGPPWLLLPWVVWSVHSGSIVQKRTRCQAPVLRGVETSPFSSLPVPSRLQAPWHLNWLFWSSELVQLAWDFIGYVKLVSRRCLFSVINADMFPLPSLPAPTIPKAPAVFPLGESRVKAAASDLNQSL